MQVRVLMRVQMRVRLRVWVRFQVQVQVQVRMRMYVRVWDHGCDCGCRCGFGGVCGCGCQLDAGAIAGAGDAAACVERMEWWLSLIRYTTTRTNPYLALSRKKKVWKDAKLTLISYLAGKKKK